MFRKVLASFVFFGCFAGPVVSEPTLQDVDAARSACRDSFLARDPEKYLEVASKMIAWGPVENPEWAKEVELCLAFASSIEGADLEKARARAKGLESEAGSKSESSVGEDQEADTLPSSDTRLSDYLARARVGGEGMEALANDIAADSTFAPPAGPDRDALEAALTSYVRPIPASQAEKEPHCIPSAQPGQPGCPSIQRSN
jgi:hypothetical protein